MIALLAAGCSANPSVDRPLSESAITEDPGRGAVIADATAQLADSGLVDWVSFSDGVVVVSIDSERREEIPADVLQRKEGYVARTIEARVDTVLWRPDHSAAQLAAGDTLEMLVFGWVLRNDRLLAMAPRNSPRLEVDGQYVMPVVEFARGWAPMTSESPLAVAESAIARADVEAWRAASPARADLEGLSFAEMASVLAGVSPSPIAARYFHLPPEQRIVAVTTESEPERPAP